MMNSDRIRVLSVDDHALLREGICAIVNAQSDMVVAGTASNGKEAIEAFRVLRPDITLMDLRLPDLSGIDVTMASRAEFPDARIIIFTTYERDVEIQRTLKAGARGYLLKSMPPREMLAAIRQVHAGKKSVPAEIAAGLAEPRGDREGPSQAHHGQTARERSHAIGDYCCPARHHHSVAGASHLAGTVVGLPFCFTKNTRNLAGLVVLPL